MGTLQEQLATDVAAVFLNTSEFASTDQYTPVDGLPRDVIGVAEEAVDGQSDSEIGDEEPVERIRYWTSRSLDSDGIDDPQIGDELVLASDPDDTPYTFSGDIPERDTDSWWLIFWRPKRRARGVRR
jgi:hypothetical protein